MIKQKLLHRKESRQFVFSQIDSVMMQSIKTTTNRTFVFLFQDLCNMFRPAKSKIISFSSLNFNQHEIKVCKICLTCELKRRRSSRRHEFEQLVRTRQIRTSSASKSSYYDPKTVDLKHQSFSHFPTWVLFFFWFLFFKLNRTEKNCSIRGSKFWV